MDLGASLLRWSQGFAVVRRIRIMVDTCLNLGTHTAYAPAVTMSISIISMVDGQCKGSRVQLCVSSTLMHPVSIEPQS